MNIYKRHRFPPDIISYAVWLYFRFNLSHRDIEDLLAQRGTIVSYESIRLWCVKFGRNYARLLKLRHTDYGDTFYIDEVFVKINGQQQYLWRAVDQDGDVIDVFLPTRRDGAAAGQRRITVVGVDLGKTWIEGCGQDASGKVGLTGKRRPAQFKTLMAQLPACLVGLVPRQHSTGGRAQLLGISKRGDAYVRGLLIHRARAVLRVSSKKTDPRSRWVLAVAARRHQNVAVVALANRMARTAYALLSKGEDYQADHVPQTA